MNNQRRKQLQKLAKEVEALYGEMEVEIAYEETGDADPDITKNISRWQLKIKDLLSELEGIRDDEEEYRESMPESLQGGERYSFSEEASESMDRAYENLEELAEAEPENFIEKLHDKYDDITDALYSAS